MTDDEVEEHRSALRVLDQMQAAEDALTAKLAQAGDAVPLGPRGRGASPPSAQELASFARELAKQQLAGRGAVARTSARHWDQPKHGVHSGDPEFRSPKGRSIMSSQYRPLKRPRTSALLVMSLMTAGCFLLGALTVALAISKDDPFFYVFTLGRLLALAFSIEGLARVIRMPADQPTQQRTARIACAWTRADLDPRSARSCQ